MKNKNLYIFNKSINNNLKLIPLKTRNYVGEVKYLPPVSKEWNNTIYAFNKHNVMNLPVNDNNIQNLIQSYFNLRFVPQFINKKYKPRSVRRKSINKIYVSDTEIKHTNSKAILTIYTFNREKIALLNKVNDLKIRLLRKIRILILKKKQILQDKNQSYLKFQSLIKNEVRKELTTLRKFKLRLDLNKYKFEEILLYKLSNILGVYYNKKVEFNLVNLKSMMFNTDIFTKILNEKLRKKKISVLRLMKFFFNKIKIPKVDKISVKKVAKKGIDFNLLENQHLDLGLISIQKKSFTAFLKKIYNNIISGTNLTKDYDKIYNIIFNCIKYKNMAGVRLQVKGRLSNRNTANRAEAKVQWKGSLKNLYSSYNGLSAVKFRGYLNSNIDYTMVASKRRVGSFAVKGWISGR